MGLLVGLVALIKKLIAPGSNLFLVIGRTHSARAASRAHKLYRARVDVRVSVV